VHAIPGAHALVGGNTAVNLDVQRAAARDRNVIIPLILGVVFLILALLLRAILAPVLLIATVVLSFAASLGVSALVFDHVFGFGGADTSFPLFVFVFRSRKARGGRRRVRQITFSLRINCLMVASFGLHLIAHLLSLLGRPHSRPMCPERLRVLMRALRR
jgi:hypothetical protein